MKTFNSNNTEKFNKINDLYFAYRHDPLNEEVREPFFEAVGHLANCIAPVFPGREDEFGNLGDIYITMHDFANGPLVTDFLSEVIELIFKEFGKNTNNNAA